MQYKSKKLKKYYRQNITQQMKFHLLKLIIKDKLIIKQAAKIVGINYSTAKTIIFFHRNRNKSYQFDLYTEQNKQNISTKIVASFLDIPISLSTSINNKPIIESIDIISTIGSKQTNIDVNSLQTKFMNKKLNTINSLSQKSLKLTNKFPNDLSQLNQLNNYQNERRIARAKSAKQAAGSCFYRSAEKQENSYQEVSNCEQLKQEQWQSEPLSFKLKMEIF